MAEDAGNAASVTRQLTVLINKLQSEKSTLQQENTTLKADLSKHVAENKELRSSLDALAGKFEKLLSERNELRSLTAALQQKNAALTTSERRLKASLESAEEEVRDLQNALQQQKELFDERCELLRAETSQATQRLASRNTALEEAHMQLSELRQKLQQQNRWHNVTDAMTLLLRVGKSIDARQKRRALQRWASVIVQDALKTAGVTPISSLGSNEASTSSDTGTQVAVILDGSSIYIPTFALALRWRLAVTQAQTLSLENSRLQRSNGHYEERIATLANQLDDAQVRASRYMSQTLTLETQLLAEQQKSGHLSAALRRLSVSNSDFGDSLVGQLDPVDQQQGELGGTAVTVPHRKRCGVRCQENALQVAALQETLEKHTATVDAQNTIISRMHEEVTRLLKNWQTEEIKRLHLVAVLKKVRLLVPKDVDAAVAMVRDIGSSSTEGLSAFAVKDLLTEIGALEASNGAVSTYSAQASLVRALNVIQQRLENQSLELNEAVSRVDRMRAEKNAVEQHASLLAAQCSGLELECAELRDRNIDVEARIAVLEAEQQSKDVVIEELHSRLNVSEQQLSDAQGALQQALAKDAESSAACRFLREQLVEVEAQVDNANEAIGRLEAAGLHARQHLQQQTALRAHQLNDAYSSQELQRRAEESATEGAALRKELHAAQQEVIRHKDAADRYLQEGLSLSAQFGDMQAQLTKMSDRVAELEDENDRLTAQLEQARASSDVDGAQLNRLEQLLADKCKRIDEVEDRLMISKDLLKQMEEVISAQTQSLTSAQGYLQAKEQEIERLKVLVGDPEQPFIVATHKSQQGSASRYRAQLQLLLRQMTVLVRFAEPRIPQPVSAETQEVHQVVTQFSEIRTSTNALLLESPAGVSLRTPPKPTEPVSILSRLANEDSTAAPPLELQDLGKPDSAKEVMSVVHAKPTLKAEESVLISASKLAAYEATIAQQGSLISSLRGSVEELKLQLEALQANIQRNDETVSDSQERIVMLAMAMENARQACEREAEQARVAYLEADKLANTLQTLTRLFIPCLNTTVQDGPDTESGLWSVRLSTIVLYEILELLNPDVGDAAMEAGVDAADQVELIKAMCTSMAKHLQLPDISTSDASDPNAPPDIASISKLRIALAHAESQLSVRGEEIALLHSRNVGLVNESQAVMAECLRLTEEFVNKTDEIHTLRSHIRELHDVIGQKESEIAALNHLADSFGRVGLEGIRFLSPRALGFSPTPRRQVQIQLDDKEEEEIEEARVPDPRVLPVEDSAFLPNPETAAAPEADASASVDAEVSVTEGLKPLPTLAELASDELQLDDLPEVPGSSVDKAASKHDDENSSALHGRGASLFAALMSPGKHLNGNGAS